MKRTRILFFVTALTLTFALAGSAQVAGRMGGQGMRGGAPAQQGTPQNGIGSPRWLVAYLGLTEEQLAQWQAIRESVQAQVAPLAEQRRLNAEQIRTYLEGGSADPAAVGALVIANYGIGTQIRTIHDQAGEAFVALLTPEQKEKYDRWLELRNALPRRGPGGAGEGPAGGTGFGGGFGFGPGDGTCPFCQN